MKCYHHWSLCMTIVPLCSPPLKSWILLRYVLPAQLLPPICRSHLNQSMFSPPKTTTTTKPCKHTKQTYKTLPVKYPLPSLLGNWLPAPFPTLLNMSDRRRSFAGRWRRCSRLWQDNLTLLFLSSYKQCQLELVNRASLAFLVFLSASDPVYLQAIQIFFMMPFIIQIDQANNKTLSGVQQEKNSPLFPYALFTLQLRLRSQ